MRTSFTDLIRSVATANYSAANRVFGNIMQQLVADRLAVEKTHIFKEEAEMTDAQMKKREEIVKSMKGSTQDFKDRYGDRWKDVMYATATKQAMGEAEDDTKYQEYFRSMLKKHGYDSPADIPDDKKDDFFNAVDAGYSAKDESWKRTKFNQQMIKEDVTIQGFIDFFVYYNGTQLVNFLISVIIALGAVIAMTIPGWLSAIAKKYSTWIRESERAYKIYQVKKTLSHEEIQRTITAAKAAYDSFGTQSKYQITALSNKLKSMDLESPAGKQRAAGLMVDLARFIRKNDNSAKDES